MTTKHKIDVLRSGCQNGMDWEAEYEITFSFRKGSRASVLNPADPCEVEFVSISPGAGDHGAFSGLAQKDLEEWAEDWLTGGDHDDEIMEVVAADDDAAREAAAENRRDA